MEYQVLCNHTRHTVIVVDQTAKLTQYLAINPEGVASCKMPTPAFQKEYSIKMKYSPREAAGKFLTAAIRGYTFNSKAILNLKDIIMNDNTNPVTEQEAAAIAEASAPTEKQLAAAEKKAKTAAKVKEAKPPKEAKPRGFGVGAFAVEQINAGKTNAEILEMVKEKWPEAKTSAASLAWYRNDIKKAQAK